MKGQLESNPQTAKLYSENESLLLENKKIAKELGDTFDSLSHQYKSAIEFTEELRQYLKEFIERDEED